jgi:hypothetical protein
MRGAIRLFRSSVSSLACLLAIACDGSSSSSPSTSPPETRVVIRATDRTFVSALPAELKVTLGATSMSELGVHGIADEQIWSTTAQVAMDQAIEGRVSVTLPTVLLVRAWAV